MIDESLKQRDQRLGYLADTRKVFKPPGPCMNTNKEENSRMRERISAFADDEGVTNELDATDTQDED